MNIPQDLSEKNLWILDLDGTIFDPSQSLRISWEKLFRKFGKSTKEVFDFSKFIGMPLDLVLSEIGFTDEEKEVAAHEFNRLMSINYQKTTIYPGALEFLKWLAGHNKRIIFFTSKSHSRCIKLFERFDIKQDFLIADDPSLPELSKPSTSGVSSIMEVLDIRPESAIYLGDTDVDRIAANSLNIDFIFASWGFGDFSGDKYYSESLEDILEFLKSKNVG